MADGSAIEWTEATWNPVVGCSVISPGCANCYAMRMAGRLELMGLEKYRGVTRKSGGRTKWNGVVRMDPSALQLPDRWKEGRLIFVNSMSDLFHEKVTLGFIKRVFDVMGRNPRHVFQVLTKRPERAAELSPFLDWHSNIWLGASVETAKYKARIDALRQTPARIRFLSCEPLLGPLAGLNLQDIDWVIAGGESGPGARPVKAEWVRSLRDQCAANRIAFHFKQWGGINKKKTGRLLDGRTWDDLPYRPGAITMEHTRFTS